MFSVVSAVNLLVLSCLNAVFLVGECNSCGYLNETSHLSLLQGVWPVVQSGNSSVRYDINLCAPLSYDTSPQKEQCVNSAVCAHFNNTARNLGNYITAKTDFSVDAFPGVKAFNLFLTGSKCGNKVARSVIAFMCGEHLGSPELSLYGECAANFFWRTSAACEIPPKRNEVPCYVVNSKGDKIDLSDLIKTVGGHHVQTADSSLEFIVNVCSDIIDTSDTKCPANTSACRSMNGIPVSVGELKSGLTLTEEGLVLIYEAEDYNGCIMKPSTKLIFRCPKRLQSRPPRLISKSFCQYEVEWETELACPESILVGDIATCQFTQADHGIQIDLSPLRKTTGQYKVPAVVNNKSVDFYLNVCGGLNNMTCYDRIWQSTSVCVHDVEKNSSKIIGTIKGSELKYADGQILLTYGKGQCTDDLNQATVISFVCSNDKDDGPKYVSVDKCVHYFEWKTPHACIKGPLETSCIVEKGDRIIDLLRLQKSSGQAWEAFDFTEPENNLPKNLYFMNVCGSVSKLGDLSKCREGTALCMLDNNGKFISLGRFDAAPKYDDITDSVILDYTNGDTCDGNSNWSSSIRFICQPGHVGMPILNFINKEKCQYEFEWRTAAVCPLGVITGSDCKIYDHSLGLSVDLNPLRFDVYEVNTPSQKFFLGVCENIYNSCSLGSSAPNVSACLFNKTDSSSKAVAIGLASDKLSYVNGYINLTYEAQISAQPELMSYVNMIFMCDEDAGKGNPSFIKSINQTYEFHWYTDLVCEKSTSATCTVHDPVSHNVYDLSSLSLPDRNWEASYTDGDIVKRLYINVCRRLIPERNCDQKASACVVEGDGTMGKSSISNAGQYLENLKVTTDHYLQLNYSHGSPCVSYGVNTTQSTIIHFLCAEDPSREQGPRFLGRAGNCQLLFLWTTKAACPTGDIIVNDSCQLTDPFTGFNFDLSSLRRELSPYTVSSKSRTFQLNICGPVKGGCFNGSTSTSVDNTAICEAAPNGTLVLQMGLANSYRMKYSKGKDLTLIYGNQKKGSSSVEIRFLCMNVTDVPIFHFVKEEKDTVFFEMKTSLACETEYFQCQFTDPKGLEYDLSPLASNLGSNYVVGDSRRGHSNLRYHLNFCRPLHRISLYKCPGGATAACQIDVHDDSGMGLSLGTQYLPPSVSNDGTISIVYTNGSECANGQFKRSTRINLFCSQIEGVLVFIGETPECEYIFSMNTPFACPLQSSLGSNCTVKEPMFGYQFDLKPLQGVVTNVTVGEYKYFISVCNGFQNMPDGCQNTGVCQTKPTDPNFPKSLGVPNSNLVYNKGLILLTYEFGAGGCHGRYNRSSVVTFTCDHNATESAGPVFITEAEDCTYVFAWPTKYACPPSRSVKCTVEDDDGQIYDLSKLSLNNDNYYVKSSSPTKTYVLNVCKSVVHTPESICPYSAAACLLDKSNPDFLKRAISMGEATRGPYIENGKLRVKYSSGDSCMTNSSSARFMETIIDFNCDRHALGSAPEYIGKDDCTYYFDWSTPYACPIREMESIGDCTVEDPQTGFLFNLTSLRHDTSYSIQSGNHLFNLNVCGTVKGSACGNETGVCQEETDGKKRHWSAGKPNGNLELRDNMLFLNYSGGDSCHSDRYKRNTIIQFRCGTDETSTSHPTFLYESADCSYYFAWTTKLACRFEVHCAIRNGSNHYDLSPLSTAGYYIARSTVLNDDSVYFINVCGPLFNMQGTTCPPSASICKVGSHNESGEDLGSIAYPPFIDFEGYPTTVYNGGSQCKTNPSEDNRARILFLCDRNQLLGEPVLIDITSDVCFYLFEWRTSLVCPSVIPPTNTSFEGPCMYKDIGKGIYFDLTSLRKPGSYYEIKENGTEGAYLLNVCDTVKSANLPQCSGSSICYQGKNTVDNYGTASTQRFTYDGKRLRLSSADGDDCPHGEEGKRSSEVFFVCNPSVGIGKPRLYKKYTCLVVFMWETNIVCRNLQHQCMFDVDGNLFDLHLLSSMSHNWNLTDKSGNTYYINLCRGILQNEQTSGCPPSSAICMKDEHGSHMPLGMTYTVSASKDESSNLLLTYDSQSNQPCQGLKLAPDVNATTRIFLTCGNTLGNPELMSGPDDRCYYNFIWKTSLVCPVETEELLLGEDGILYDKRLKYGMNLQNILNRTYLVPGNTGADNYMYQINLSGNFPNGKKGFESCALSAVCQTKPSTTFHRDVGSFDTKKFYLTGSELHLKLFSLSKACGKQSSRNVTTVINMQCSSSAGNGTPIFLYETGGCDYVFDWETDAVCAKFFTIPYETDNSTQAPQVDHGTGSHVSSSQAPLVICILFLVCCACIVIFILSKQERRSAVASKFRVCFSRVTMPRFRYKRGNDETSVIVDGMQPKNFYCNNDDDEDLLL